MTITILVVTWPNLAAKDREKEFPQESPKYGSKKSASAPVTEGF
jgi:hypothetical protein